jgi:hypothetical protein
MQQPHLRRCHRLARDRCPSCWQPHHIMHMMGLPSLACRTAYTWPNSRTQTGCTLRVFNTNSQIQRPAAAAHPSSTPDAHNLSPSPTNAYQGRQHFSKRRNDQLLHCIGTGLNSKLAPLLPQSLQHIPAVASIICPPLVPHYTRPRMLGVCATAIAGQLSSPSTTAFTTPWRHHGLL